jgi:hypothetical protein
MARNRIDERQDTHVARSRSLTSASDLLLEPQTLHVNGPINCPRGTMESLAVILPESEVRKDIFTSIPYLYLYPEVARRVVPPRA